MRKFLLLACLSGFSIPALASCDDVKAQIDAKIQAKGVKEYTLEVQPVKSAKEAAVATSASAVSAVSAAKESNGKVVGTCDGDSKQIIYRRL